MKILAIETSCDDTGVAILECTDYSYNALGNQLLSQIQKHRKYGGVYPNLAKRLHSQNLVPLLKEVLREAGSLNLQPTTYDLQPVKVILEREPALLEQFMQFVPGIEKPDIDAIAVTQGPGLEPALWVGINFAKALSAIWNIPIVPVNHMEGHIASVLYQPKTNDQQLTTKELDFSTQRQTSVGWPALALLISGGHTELVLAEQWGVYQLLGKTRDDAVGEAFDKVGRMLDLPYPGGPEISHLAQQVRNSNPQPTTYNSSSLKTSQSLNDPQLPRPMINTDNYDFSFSGLKTAVLYLVRDKKMTHSEKTHIALEFENAIADVLIAKTQKALLQYQPHTLIVAGGVIANPHLRDQFQQLIERYPDITLRIPHPDVTGDNAIMIGIAGALSLQQNTQKTSADSLAACGNLSLAK